MVRCILNQRGDIGYNVCITTMEHQPKKLYRSQKDKVVAGICGGLGEYFAIDPIIFRILFVVLALLNGAGVLLYIILIFVIPPEGKEAPLDAHTDLKERIKGSAETVRQEAQEFAQKMKGNEGWFKEKRNIIGLIVIGIGCVALLHRIFPVVWFSMEIIGPAIIILIGLFIVFRKK